MYAKIFSQIFDSSLAENYLVRHVFEDLLKLARSDGVVDMTHEAIARRTNVPEDIIRDAITLLEQPDLKSRSKARKGARLVRLDQHRDWGWRIVNFTVYRRIASELDRRELDRLRKEQWRIKKSENSSQVPVTPIAVVQDNIGTSPDEGGTHADSHASASVCTSASLTGKGEVQEGKGIEIEFKTAMASVPIQLSEQLNGWQDFAEMVFNAWSGRDGRDGSGVCVRFAAHLRKRWNEEGESWRQHCHPKQKSKPVPAWPQRDLTPEEEARNQAIKDIPYQKEIDRLKNRRFL